jgi:acetyl esterase/lipase
MKTAALLPRNPTTALLTTLLCSVLAQDAVLPTNAIVAAALPPLPAPLGMPKPGPTNDAPYAPQPILPGGVVVTLYPPGSPYLNMARIREAEQYFMNRGVPGRIESIVNIHNPSIEVHVAPGTGAAIILAAGGGHATLNVGPEASDFVPFFYNYGVTSIILRNRLRRDGYNSRTDEVYDALQAIKMVRAHAKDWRIDPSKIGIMGFSAGAELSAPAAIQFEEFDRTNNTPDNPLAGFSSRPDFVGIIYPGPSPFNKGATPAIPRNVPPAFLACAGSGDQQHAVWADEYFAAMLALGAPDLEMHIYGRGQHAGGLSDRQDTPYGTWQYRFIDWFRDLGFLQKPGIETQAAKDVAAFVNPPPARVRVRAPQGALGTPLVNPQPNSAPTNQ